MSDYCGKYYCCHEEKECKEVCLKFLRDELLYDIGNCAYVEADVMGDNAEHARHVVADVCEEGNRERVLRVLGEAHAHITELLYPYTKSEVSEGERDDRATSPDAYVVEMSVPSEMSGTTINHLSHQIHEYMVCRALSDWLCFAGLKSAELWAGKAAAAEAEIKRVKHLRRSVFTRPLRPW